MRKLCNRAFSERLDRPMRLDTFSSRHCGSNVCRVEIAAPDNSVSYENKICDISMSCVGAERSKSPLQVFICNRVISKQKEISADTEDICTVPSRLVI